MYNRICAGKVETFYTPKRPGTYRIQCWGAQGGGNSSYPGGRGAYTKGDLTLTQGENLYVCVGQNGNYGADTGSLLVYNNNNSYRYSTIKVFNNGCSNLYVVSKWCYAGGGSTDIRLGNGNGDWTNFNSRKSRIMVAASGGGSMLYYYTPQSGTAAGGLNGYSGGSIGPIGVAATAATQTSRGKDGTGNNCGVEPDNSTRFGIVKWAPKSLGGAGSGYYSGGDANHGDGTVGTGSTGSCFISGYTGCNAIKESSTETNIEHTGQANHYSGKVFTNTQMLDGKKSMPSPDGGTETGHTGDGVCIITQLSFN